MRMRGVAGVQTGLTVDSTAAGITLTVPTDEHPNGAHITVYGAPIRFWVDGTAPTTTTGHRADVYADIFLEDNYEVENFKGIRETGVSATLEITYYDAVLP